MAKLSILTASEPDNRLFRLKGERVRVGEGAFSSPNRRASIKSWLFSSHSTALVQSPSASSSAISAATDVHWRTSINTRTLLSWL
eukprot:2088805-Rhodomonas_salina.1